MKIYQKNYIFEEEFYSYNIIDIIHIYNCIIKKNKIFIK